MDLDDDGGYRQETYVRNALICIAVAANAQVVSYQLMNSY